MLKSYLILARPHQYIKNGFVLLPLFFAHKFTDPATLLNGLYALLAFSFGASAIYVFNDVLDAASDRVHPQKSKRPVAAGAVSPERALFFAAFMLCLSLVVALPAGSPAFLWLLLGYFVLNILYSLWLKKIVLVDICCIGIGFVLRILAGGAVAEVPVSHWIIIITFLLALFLALAKRRDDVRLVHEKGIQARDNAVAYNTEFILSAMVVMASVTVVSYIMYTVSPEVIALHGTDKLYLTSFWVLLGFLRYMHITFVENNSGSPTLVLLRDVFLQLVICSWLVNFFLLLYVGG